MEEELMNKKNCDWWHKEGNRCGVDDVKCRGADCPFKNYKKPECSFYDDLSGCNLECGLLNVEECLTEKEETMAKETIEKQYAEAIKSIQKTVVDCSNQDCIFQEEPRGCSVKRLIIDDDGDCAMFISKDIVKGK